jgi:hypothetical protein
MQLLPPFPIKKLHIICAQLRTKRNSIPIPVIYNLLMRNNAIDRKLSEVSTEN